MTESRFTLDYTGGGLYAQSQLDAHMAQLAANVYGNPHSSNPTSMAATKLVDQARDYVRHFFNADLDEYAVIFTANASGALKLLGESYPFEQDGQYLLTFDNHNSVNGIREYAAHHGAKVQYAPIALPDLCFDEKTLRDLLTAPAAGSNRLFAFPAQSKFQRACSMIWPGSTLPGSRVGMYCWIVLLTCLPIDWTSRS